MQHSASDTLRGFRNAQPGARFRRIALIFRRCVSRHRTISLTAATNRSRGVSLVEEIVGVEAFHIAPGAVGFLQGRVANSQESSALWRKSLSIEPTGGDPSLSSTRDAAGGRRESQLAAAVNSPEARAGKTKRKCRRRRWPYQRVDRVFRFEWAK